MDNQRFFGIVQSGGPDGPDAPLPLANATVTLYSTTPGNPVVIGKDTSDGAGRFSISHPDPTSDGIYYVVADCGGGTVLATVIGETYVAPFTVNELTTMATAFAMAQFLGGGVIRGDAFPLRIAAGMAANLADPLTGGPSKRLLEPPNADQSTTLRATRALGNLVAACARDVAGAWSELQFLATPPGEPVVRDTLDALHAIAAFPANQVEALYDQSKAADVYRPTLEAAPDAWTLAVKVNDTGSLERMFGGPANIAFDDRGYAWIANNVFQGQACSGDFIVVLKPDGSPADGTDGTPASPLVGNGMNGPGFGIVRNARDGTVWVGSFGWGDPHTTCIQSAGIVSTFGPDGRPLTPAGLIGSTLQVQGMAFDDAGNLWITSFANGLVCVWEKGDPQKETRLTPPALDPPVQNPFDVVYDAKAGCAWVTYAGGLGYPDNNPGYVARYVPGEAEPTWIRQIGYTLKGLALDSQGNVWIASGGDDTVYTICVETMEVTGFPRVGGIRGPWGVSVDGNDDVWVANFGEMGPAQDYTEGAISKLAGWSSPSGLAVGTAISPSTGYTLKTAGEPVRLADGSIVYTEGQACMSPLMRQTSVPIDAAGNLWAVNNWKPGFGTDFEPSRGDPGGDGICIFVGLAAPPRVP